MTTDYSSESVRVFLGLGSNQGDSVDIVRNAFRELGQHLRQPRLSSLWRSQARYLTDQPDFINAVAVGETRLLPRELLATVNAVEAAFGRDRLKEIHNGPRPLDIDILLYGKKIIVENDLIVPHPGLRERKFVLVPLLELDPDLEDPVSGERFSRTLATLPAQGIYLHDCGGYDRLHLWT
ncbi:MAG: 2-amino-4-hydroxy-6-hydroxymethyldihydropteridine diphosphokinase [Spirochaetaceae bacterium]|nr:2-amino-4-hydroxy-6-hydroxymethyldihydropteridine diphosphokinase [Spirochaetaceae bacterium]